MKLKMIVAAVAAVASTSVLAAGSMNDQVADGSAAVNVRTDVKHSQKMLNNQQVTGSVLDILNARNSGDIDAKVIYIGGKGEVYAHYSGTSGASVSDNSITEVRMPYFDLAFTSSFGDWVTGFADIQVNNSASSNLTLPNAYFVVGDLGKSPFYAFAGKKVVEFGKFDSATNFMPTLTRAYFMPYGAQVGAGYSKDGINFVATLMNGKGASMINSQSSSSQHINNFAFNASYSGDVNNLSYYAGLGYVNATGFSDGIGIENKMVGAFDLNAGINIQQLVVNGEFLITTSGVKGSNSTSLGATGAIVGGDSLSIDSVGYSSFGINALPTFINFTSGSTVKAWSINSSYTLSVTDRDVVPYVSYSQISQNSDNNLYQFEVGTRYNITDSVWLGGSYNYISGKAHGNDIGKYNTVMLDATVSF